jgi:hypothetical protein
MNTTPTFNDLIQSLFNDDLDGYALSEDYCSDPSEKTIERLLNFSNALRIKRTSIEGLSVETVLN